ncbi:ParB N-terminal domain-containing protein [Actinoplanes awajinensis]|uniref:ParB/Sulfiredoxin domain-containing protein n=1 Tax=Actinoplanes awajinensis subsp. mycoplanecinus TaxID=135947 RepID=A0A101JBG5_9ACTN|nr:ParB N-terminal domain-containing protein [Actinoplanes awajinensis]KUL23702.1 hypothetical protein ADL15_45330 [Actinoplanes awajinensis subsp. mycoplanecinus]
MTLAEVLATYRPSVGGDTWKSAIPDLLADADSAQCVELLRSELVVNGGFAQPILVDPEAREILDGMHRIAAALRNRHDWLKVADSPSDLPDPRRVQATLGAAAVTSTLVDRLARVLRSFPFPGGWTNCDGLFPGDVTVTGWWQCPEGFDAELASELIARAAADGIELVLLSLTPLDDPTAL